MWKICELAKPRMATPIRFVMWTPDRSTGPISLVTCLHEKQVRYCMKRLVASYSESMFAAVKASDADDSTSNR